VSAISLPGRTLRAVIVDDEPLARERLRTLLAEEPDIALIAECADGATAVTTIARERPDLVFLDVQMPECSGFDVLAALPRDLRFGLIFVTAYDRYALEAFEVHALDYLLKPFDRERFQRALGRMREQWAREERAAGLEQRLLSLLEAHDARKGAERIMVRSRGRVFFLRTDAIDWIEAAGNYARVHVGREDHLLRETMKALETRLDPGLFVRIHRSAIVNVERIQELRPSFHGEYVVRLAGGTELTSSRGYSEGLRRLWTQ
jgi:two-component system LytT family response regulator